MGSASSKSTEPPAVNDDDPWELLTYLPPYAGHFEYSHTHFLYSNDLEKLEDLPPPHTAPTRKLEFFDPDDYVHVDERTDAVKDGVLEKPLTELIRLLTGDYEDDVSKVRAIYRWVTAQPVESRNYKKGAKPNTAMYQLWHLKNKRNTYAAFFSLLCGYAGLPCAIVRGYLKGSTYEVGQKINKDTHRGEWNAVLVDGNWRLVNAFWGACVLSGEQQEEYWYTCDENFFLTDPQQLIFTHFPEEGAWQLLDTKKTLREFETMAFLKDRFFNLEMRLLSHPECNIVAVNGEAEILFGLHPDKSANQTFLCIPTVFKNDKSTTPIEIPQKNVQLDFIHRPNDNVLSVKVRFPAVGIFKLEIVGKDTTVQNADYDFDWIAIYKVSVPSIPKKQTFFPVLEAAGWGPSKILEEFGLEALSHQNGVINVDPGPLEVKFKVINEEKAAKAHLVHKMLAMGGDAEVSVAMATKGFKRQGNIVGVSIDVEPGEFKLKVSHTFGKGHERNLCNYHVVCKEPEPEPEPEEGVVVQEVVKPRTPPKDHVGELRTLLREAITSKDLEKLERAVDMTESRGFAHKLQDELKEAKDLITRLRRLQRLIHEVMTLNQRTISEIRSYTHPKEEIHVVMRATLLLLGNPEEETKIWPNVQALIGKTGKQSLKRRIQELDVNKLSTEHVKRCRTLLAGIELEEIVGISSGAATFYKWASGITDEHERRQDPIVSYQEKQPKDGIL